MLTTTTSFNKAKISEYNNVEILDLAYHNHFTELPEEVFSLPKLNTIAFGNEQMNAENWAKFVLQISQNPQIKHLHLACFPNFPADITPIKQLVSLELSRDTRYFFTSHNTNKGISFENFAKQLNQLPDLEELSIDFKYNEIDDISSDAFNAIADIKSLQKLKIDIGKMENYHFGKLKNIKKLELSTTSINFSEDINEMTSLEELHLQDVKLTHLHLTKELKNLHTITFNFSWKKHIKSFISVSDDFFRLLPQIKHLELNDLPKSGNTKVLTDLHEIFKQMPLENNIITKIDTDKYVTTNKAALIADVITKNNTDKYATEDLLDILHIKKAQIDNFTWIILEKRLEKELLVSLENVKTYFLLGKSTRSLDLRKILKSLGWKATKNSENADCIVVSRGFAGASNTGANSAGVSSAGASASIDFDAKKAVSDTYLFAWAEEKTGFERFDENMNTNLLLLLKSEEFENQALGIDLLTNAYTSSPQIDACLLGIALFTENKNLREKTKKFIEKNLSSSLLTEYKKHNRRGNEKETYQIIKNLPEIDILTFAEIALLAGENKYDWEKFGFQDILQLGGEMMPKAIESLQYLSSNIEIPLDIERLHPDFVTYFPADCTSLVCHNPLPEVQKVLFSIKNIKEIAFDYFREDFLHEDIGNMKSLEKIGLNIGIQNFPKTLSKLTQIKQLALSNDEINAIPDVFSSWKNLENIRFFTKKLAIIPAWITDFKKLKIVSIFSIAEEINVELLFEIENLEEMDLKTIAFTFKKPLKPLTKLKKFSLNTIQTTSTNTTLHNACLEDVIAVCPTDLEEFTFESRFLGVISDNLSKFIKLKKLVLSGSFDQIPACIAGLPLETLWLQSDNFTEFPTFLKKNITLKTVKLSSNFRSQEKKLRKMMPNIDFYI